MQYATLKVDFALHKGIYQIENMTLKEPTITYTTTSFADILGEVGITYYVNNLNMLYVYLIKYLCDHHIDFEYSYKNGKCSNVKLPKYEIYFVNFKSKFGVEFDEADDTQNWLLIDYAIAKGRTRLSLGADAYNEFLLTIFTRKPEPNANHKLMRETFPIFEYDDILLEAKANAYGYQYVKRGWYEQAFDYDISSSYPASALNDLPCGLPHFYDTLEAVPQSYFKIINFTFYNLKLKPKGIDFLNVGHMGTLSLTQRIFEEFNRNYDCTIKIRKIEAFKTRKSVLEKFINNTIVAGKLTEKNKRIASYNKFIGNAIIGYLGRNTKTIVNKAHDSPQGLVFDKEEKNIDPIYLPAHLAILDASKARFLRTLRPLFDKVIYANTDGFITTAQVPLERLNAGITHECLGKFRQQHTYKQLYIESINGYAGINDDGELENTISGMSIEQAITPHQFADRNFPYYVNEPTRDGKMRCRIITQH